MASHQRNRRKCMKWERYHQRFPMSGKHFIGRQRIHDGHVKAFLNAQCQGKSYPQGIRRTPYTLRER